MTPRTSISRKGESSLSLAAGVEVMVVIQHPQRIDTLDLGMRTLLPINPPEIHAFVFEGMVQLFEIGFEKVLVCTFEWNRLDHQLRL